MDSDSQGRMDRRQAIKWILAAGAGAAMAGARPLFGQAGAAAAPRGYGTDPDLMKAYKPGDIWPLTFSAAERRAAAALCEVILPADGASPGAAAVGVPDFLDEWVSAPYPDNAADRPRIVGGLAWLDAESTRRAGAAFADAPQALREAICADLAPWAPDGSPLAEPSRFFLRFRDLAAAGYYTTPEGMKAIGYVGNLPLAKFEGPPAALIERLGLSGEVQA
jgi:hypothetical protein